MGEGLGAGGEKSAAVDEHARVYQDARVTPAVWPVLRAKTLLTPSRDRPCSGGECTARREPSAPSPRDVSAYEDKRVLSDPDFEDNLDRTLESLNVTRGKFLTIVDEDGMWGNLAAAIGVLPCVHL